MASQTTFAPDVKRDAAAAEIAAGSGSWLRITLREQCGAFKAGSRFYGIPSSRNDGSIYFTNLRFCSCPDYAKRDIGCKHQRSVALHVEQIAAAKRQQAQPARRPSVSLVPACSVEGCDDNAGNTGMCWQHARQVVA